MLVPKFAAKYFSRRLQRYGLALLIDTAVALTAFLLAYITIFTFRTSASLPYLSDKLALYTLCATGSFIGCKLYRGSWRYVSIPDLITIVKASIITLTLFTVAAFLLSRGAALPRSVLVLSAIYLVMGLSGVRIAYRIAVEQFIVAPGAVRRPNKATKVLLCGYSDAAESFIRANRRGGSQRFAIAGILDDSHLNVGRSIQGVDVLGSIDDLESILGALARTGLKPTELVITEINLSRKRLAHIVEVANSRGLKVSRIPDLTETATLTGDQLLEPRPIELADLLERPEVTADLEGVGGMIGGRKVLVTGAGGSIGSELSRQIAAFGPARLLIADSSEFHLFTLHTELLDRFPVVEIEPRLLDIRDRSRVDSVFTEFRPEVIFHAAALKHVPLVEENPLEAIKTNIIGTRNVADAALANGAMAFVMISTDKAVNPTSVMGATKRVAEAYCQSLDISSNTTRFKTVRFGNVLGSNGSVVPRFKEQIAAGGPVTVTHPQIVRYFMTIPEAVMLVLNASAHALDRSAERGKIMVLDMGKPVRIADLAERMIQLAGFRPGVDIEIVFTGLRRGEKLYEELFDPSEVQDGEGGDGYLLASPRIVDRNLLDRTLTQFGICVEREDPARAVQLLQHLVPEFRRGSTAPAVPSGTAELKLRPAKSDPQVRTGDES